MRKYDRHRVSICIHKRSELSAKHVVRYTGVNRCFVITMSRTLGVAEKLQGTVVRVFCLYIRQEFSVA